MSDEMIGQEEVTIDASHIMIGEERVELKKMNAAQVAKFANIIGESLISSNKKLKELKASDNTGLALGILASIDERALVRLGSCLTGKDEAFVAEQFDLAWVMEALMKQLMLSNIRGILRNFTLLSSQIQ